MRISSLSQRRAFTWIELLVVVIMTVILLALILPAMSKVHRASERTMCMNNLRQIGIATHHYADTHLVAPENKPRGELPPGTLVNASLAVEQRLSWYVELLPYIEEENRYKAIQRDKPWDYSHHLGMTQTMVRVFVCPDWTRDNNSEVTFHTPYVGIAGVGADAATLPLTDPRAGALGYDRALNLSKVPDGTSTTMLVLETADNPGPWAQGGPATLRGLDPSRKPYYGEGCSFGNTHHTKSGWFGKAKATGGTALMLDGSVRWLNHGVSDETLEALATIAGGDKPGSDW